MSFGGQLFSAYFLDQGIVETPEWPDLTADSPVCRDIRKVVEDNIEKTGLDESDTEVLLIEPILNLLGYSFLRQKSPDKHGRSDVPDFLLFADNESRSKASEDKSKAFIHGCAILEAKRLNRPLDRGDQTDPIDPRVPANQILRYLSSCSVASNDGIRFGILTNGRLWRLYDNQASSRSDAFIEIDMFAALGLADHDRNTGAGDAISNAFRLFVLLFRRAALPSPHGDGLLVRALESGRHFEAEVAESLRDVVFGKLFAKLASALDRNSSSAVPVTPAEVYEATLVFMYRLLFLFYAEDRGLLPAGSKRYDDYSLTRIREDIARRVDQDDVFSDQAARYDSALLELFRIIDEGDDSIGIPPYNGGLFAGGAHPILDERRIPDRVLADVIDELSRVRINGHRQWVNYRDLDVRRLGSIYEGLLEHRLERSVAGELVLMRDTFARKNTGSYYTHDDLVQLCISQSLAPSVESIRQVFEDKLTQLRNDKRSKKEMAAILAQHSPADAVLKLRILDPAMGSGHFLVAVVDHLADQVLELMEQAAEAGSFCSYVSPLEERIEKIRKHVLDEAETHGWDIDTSKLEDRHIVKRMVLKRVIYGIDLNPMAVELSKLSLWLSCFAVGAPLSFLDHHLKCGNSLVGSDIEDLEEHLGKSGMLGTSFQGMVNAAGLMENIAMLTDADIADVKESARFYEEAQGYLQPFMRALDLLAAHDFLIPLDSKAAKGWMSPRSLVSGDFGDPIKVASGEVAPGSEAIALRERAISEAQRLRFFHWKLAFPEVWWQEGKEHWDPGFDAVIGNPPWDRIKLQENEFFALRDPAIAGAGRASDRKKLIRELPDSKPDLWSEYQIAAEDATRLARHAREGGSYPLLSRGDPNLYALFVERALGLLKRSGRMSMVMPSGIVADKEKAQFFKMMVEQDRVASVFDFENGHRGGLHFFPEVDRRFKFCVFTLRGGSGIGEAGKEKTIDCGFYLHHVDETRNPDHTFTLTAEQVAMINPNTGTLPVFRSQRDVELTAAIYERIPVLIRRDEDGRIIDNPWGIRFTTMFHMTNDSNLFRTMAELEADGFYRVREHGQPVYRKAEERFVRLYEGKMVQAYDHRAATVVVNPDNVHRPAQPKPVSSKEHADEKWTPDSHFWVDDREVDQCIGHWGLGFKEITAPTNVRTMIACQIPHSAVGNKLPLIVGQGRVPLEPFAGCCLLCQLNSFALDFIVRQKLAGQTLNFFIVEQLPVLPPEVFDKTIGSHLLSDWVSRQVLELTYVSEDMRPFAKALGFEGDPFPWNPERRRHLIARLDALFFHLCGLDRDAASYVLDTFPIVREKDIKEFEHYRTKDMILAYMNAVQAGDLDAIIDA